MVYNVLDSKIWINRVRGAFPKAAWRISYLEISDEIGCFQKSGLIAPKLEITATNPHYQPPQLFKKEYI